MIDFLISKNLLIPLATLLSAALAFISVILVQLFLSKRAKEESQLKITLLKREEKLRKMEDIFDISQKSIEEINKQIHSINEMKRRKTVNKEELLDAVYDFENFTRANINNRRKAFILSSIYINELKPFIYDWSNYEEQILSCCIAIKTRIEMSTDYLTVDSIDFSALQSINYDLLRLLDNIADTISNKANDFHLSLNI